MRLIVWVIREIFKMLSQYAVDYPTFPVNHRHSHHFAILAGCCECKRNTSNDLFSRCKCATNWLQMKLTITEYSLTTSTKVNYKIQKERNLYLVLRLRGDTERHRWQRDHQDPEHLQHSAHEHWHVSAQFSCLLVRFVSSRFAHHIVAQGCCACHLIHAMSVSLRLWVLHSLLLLHLPIHLLSLALLPALLPFPRGP